MRLPRFNKGDLVMVVSGSRGWRCPAWIEVQFVGKTGVLAEPMSANDGWYWSFEKPLLLCTHLRLTTPHGTKFEPGAHAVTIEEGNLRLIRGDHTRRIEEMNRPFLETV